MAKQSFAELINGEVPVLVDFHATWCGPCKMMKPELDILKSQLGDKIKIVKIDIDQNPAVADKFKVKSVPTLVVFRGGQALWRQSGAMTASQLRQVLSPYVQ